MTAHRFKSCLIAIAIAAGAPGLTLAQPALAAGATATTAELGPAAKQVRVFYDALLDSMKNAKALGLMGRYKKLEPAIDATFDFATMTKMTVGPDWAKMSPADQKALIAAFRRMTIADYAHNFDGYGGEDFVVDPKVQERAGDKIVSSQMTAPGRPPIPFVYRLDQTKAGWQICDIYLNGYVSEVATRRADFASTLQDGGPQALAKKLNALSDRTLSGQ